ncbi:hypothetical protein CcrC1_gp256c [Caulobacter phage C1]|nr:hypothetical protein CcrC1_gp256c [Caulobacter phage C1]UTU08485.1 hypothetical protein CcrC2_gp257c [Caulobacter phage C2]UTU09000.1 hypothetical protein CcrJ4_gp251c [Caulobacter phage J4]UTU10118.1 hypothetical protein CcrRB23_gp256c [Caulobacter phage RB23]WGN97153.1 hypothetical protein [Bertelyvirus sp.]
MIDEIAIHKRGEDAWDVTHDRHGRMAAIRSRLDENYKPTGVWFIRIDRPERFHADLFETQETFPSFQAAFAHICERVLA